MTKVLFTENVDPIGPELLKAAGCEVVMLSSGRRSRRQRLW